jgi:hypothetical protein
MARFTEDELPEHVEGEELVDLNATVKEDTTAETPEVKEEVPELPVKYKGKSLDDIIRMHQEAEKLIGKQAQEVGEVRKLADELIKQQLSPKKVEPPKEVEDEVDFFVDPKKAVAKEVENHPAVKAARESTQRMEREARVKSLAERHPDFMQVGQSPEFIEWVKGSRVRTALFVAADQQHDTDAADELLSTFKELRAERIKRTKEDAEVTRKQALKSAAVDTSGTGETPRKIYRRADLIRLRMNDPDRYNAMEDEIMAAYEQGRVK